MRLLWWRRHPNNQWDLMALRIKEIWWWNFLSFLTLLTILGVVVFR